MWVAVGVTGKIRDLNISWTSGEKVYRGDAVVTGKVIWERLKYEPGAAMRGHINIYAVQSKVLREALKYRHQPMIDQYADLRSLAITELIREPEYLVFHVMLPATDFNCFSGFVEANFATEVDYSISVPFSELHDDDVDYKELYAAVWSDLENGKPCLCPNTLFSFTFLNRRARQ